VTGCNESVGFIGQNLAAQKGVVVFRHIREVLTSSPAGATQASSSKSSTGMTPIATPMGFGYYGPGENPFSNAFPQGALTYLNANQAVGINKPLSRPAFLGYRNDKPIYVGTRLFVMS
jgi:hypothetical protein